MIDFFIFLSEQFNSSPSIQLGFYFIPHAPKKTDKNSSLASGKLLDKYFHLVNLKLVRCIRIRGSPVSTVTRLCAGGFIFPKLSYVILISETSSPIQPPIQY
jgi:hypothetical protein